MDGVCSCSCSSGSVAVQRGKLEVMTSMQRAMQDTGSNGGQWQMAAGGAAERGFGRDWGELRERSGRSWQTLEDYSQCPVPSAQSERVLACSVQEGQGWVMRSLGPSDAPSPKSTCFFARSAGLRREEDLASLD